MSRPLIYLDTETGGLDPTKVDILTFGALVINPDGSEQEYYYELSLPEYRDILREAVRQMKAGNLDSVECNCPTHGKFTVFAR